jgi:hypothetical protein
MPMRNSENETMRGITLATPPWMLTTRGAGARKGRLRQESRGADDAPVKTAHGNFDYSEYLAGEWGRCIG